MTTSYREDIGPVLMTAANDQFTENCRIASVIWTGSGTAGDTCVLCCPQTGAVFWEGRAIDANNYLGANLSPYGVPCPYGFKVSNISSGKVFVYLRED